MSRSTSRGRATHGPGSERVQGIAFAGDRRIAGVEVSTDDGETWAPAELREELGPLAWRFWSFDFDASPEEHLLAVRAVDGDGVPQIAEIQPALPDGSTATTGAACSPHAIPNRRRCPVQSNSLDLAQRFLQLDRIHRQALLASTDARPLSSGPPPTPPSSTSTATAKLRPTTTTSPPSITPSA